MLTDAQPLEASASTFTDSDVEAEEEHESYHSGEEDAEHILLSGRATPVSDVEDEASYEMEGGDYDEMSGMGSPRPMSNEALMFVAVQEGDDVQVENLLGRGAKIDHVDDVCDATRNL